jgi:hypothetical protein
MLVATNRAAHVFNCSLIQHIKHDVTDGIRLGAARHAVETRPAIVMRSTSPCGVEMMNGASPLAALLIVTRRTIARIITARPELNIELKNVWVDE